MCSFGHFVNKLASKLRAQWSTVITISRSTPLSGKLPGNSQQCFTFEEFSTG